MSESPPPHPRTAQKPPCITISKDYLSENATTLLENARKDAKVDRDGKSFDSETFRNDITAATLQATKSTPYTWQLDVAEALYLGLDAVVVAGTGYGKTLPFVLGHFVNPDAITIIISPLNALEYDQVSLKMKYDTRKFTFLDPGCSLQENGIVGVRGQQ